MSVGLNDLQPKPFKVKIRDQEYNCNPIKLSHRLIIGRIQPLFTAMESMANEQEVEISSDKIMELENDLDNLIGSLIPELKNITLNIEDLAELLTQIMESTIPEEAKELKEMNVEVSKDPKETTKEKITQ